MDLENHTFFKSKSHTLILSRIPYTTDLILAFIIPFFEFHLSEFNMQLKYFFQAGGLALLTGTVGAQIDTDSLGLNPVLGSNPLGGNTGGSGSSASPAPTPAPSGTSAPSEKRFEYDGLPRVAERDLGALLGGGALGNLMGGQSSSSAGPSSSAATPTSSPSASPTPMQQSNKGIFGRDIGKAESDSMIGGGLTDLLGGGGGSSSAESSAQTPSPSSSGFSTRQASPSPTPAPLQMAERDLLGNLGGGLLPDMKGTSETPGSSATPTSAASSSMTPTSMQTKARSTPVKNSPMKTGAPAGSGQATPQENQGLSDHYTPNI